MGEIVKQHCSVRVTIERVLNVVGGSCRRITKAVASRKTARHALHLFVRASLILGEEGNTDTGREHVVHETIVEVVEIIVPR
jgi:hypothetical protein